MTALAVLDCEPDTIVPLVMCSRCAETISGKYWMVGKRLDRKPACRSCFGSDERGWRRISWRRISWRCKRCGGHHDDWGWYERRYCGPDCAAATRCQRRRDRYVGSRKSPGSHICNNCHGEFPGRADALFCAASCRQAAYRRRIAAEGHIMGTLSHGL